MASLEQTTRYLASVTERQAQMAAELQDLQIAREQTARDLVSANDRQASIESRMESIEKLTNVQMAGELQKLEAATEQAARDLASANDRQASLDGRWRGTSVRWAGQARESHGVNRADDASAQRADGRRAL